MRFAPEELTTTFLAMPGPYADLLGEEQAPDDVTIVDHNAFVSNLEDAAIAALVAADAQMGDSVLMIRCLGGAFSRVDPDATAEQAWSTLEPWNRGQYGNFLGDTADINRMFSAHTPARLRATKDAWDPQNLFRHGHNIRPSSL